MAITSKEGILKVLSAYNPWWKTGAVNPKLSKTYKRFAFYEAMKRLEQTDIRRTVILTGTRRVGKTTIQYQMIEALLAKGVAPQKIVYISMDHPMLKLSGFQDILDCYHENIFAEQDVYYFFDEVQYAQDWDKWLKAIYDMQPDTQVVATGSASPALMKGNQESGAGRWSVIQVPTMSFYEYCELLAVDRPQLPKQLKITTLLRMTQPQRTQIMLQLSKVQNHFNRYLQVGGFPELALADNDIMAQQIMREDVVDIKIDPPSDHGAKGIVPINAIEMKDTVSTASAAKELKSFLLAKCLLPSLCLNFWKMTSFTNPARYADTREAIITLTEDPMTILIELSRSTHQGATGMIQRMNEMNVTKMKFEIVTVFATYLEILYPYTSEIISLMT